MISKQAGQALVRDQSADGDDVAFPDPHPVIRYNAAVLFLEGLRLKLAALPPDASPVQRAILYAREVYARAALEEATVASMQTMH